MCVSLAITAARLGATVGNHIEVVHIIKTKGDDGKEVCSGARVRDMMTGKYSRPGFETSADSAYR